MVDNSDTSSEYKLSSYNSAGNTIKRIDLLWMSAHHAVESGNYLLWNILLDRLWLEVAGDLTPDDDNNKKMNDINAKIVSLFPLTTGNVTGFNRKGESYYLKVSQQYLAIRKKEQQIKFMEHKLGLGKSYVDEFEDDWE